MKDLVVCEVCSGGGFTGDSGKPEDDACELCHGVGSVDKEIAAKIKKCSYCGEIAQEVLPTPIVADMGTGAVMCNGCWDMTRDDIKGTYGREIGSFEVNT